MSLSISEILICTFKILGWGAIEETFESLEAGKCSGRCHQGVSIADALPRQFCIREEEKWMNGKFYMQNLCTLENKISR